jgi:hypothetical protein
MTPDKEWSGHLDAIDEEEEHYGPGQVWERTFPAGVVSMRGNGGGEGYIWTSGVAGGHGSYLISLAHPSHRPVEPPLTPTCPGSGLLERDRCWYLSEVGGTCRQTCTAQGLDFSYLVGGESSPLVPMLLGREPRRRQFPWGRLECYVPGGDRYHTAHNTANANTRDNGAVEDWSYSVCQMACPCAPR